VKPAILLALALVACAPKAPTLPPIDRAAGVPAPLPARPFSVPASSRATLSNGLTVVVVENHEIPVAWVRLAFRGGGHADPVGKEGLASVTLDMLNEGAGGNDALALSAALKRLGSDLGASAGDDGASMWASGLTRNLDPTLDLFADVLLRPTFPQAEWDLLKKQRLADLDKRRKDPEWIAARVFDEILFGDAYKGRATTKASLEALTVEDMRAFWAEHLTPDRAILFAGGDITLEALVPKLEARLAGWKPSKAAGPVTQARPKLPEAGAIHVVDRPGAAQSVLRVGGYLTAPTEPEWFPLLLANQVVGGQFTARLNMNLREAKGWTYGARSGLSYDLAGGRFVASAGIHTEHTGPALAETLAEIEGPRAAKPLTAREFDDGRSAIVQGYPLRFESPDYLLGQEENVWRYALPADWVSGYVARLAVPTLDQAAAAWNSRVDPSRLVVVVVGDLAKIRPELEKLGRPIIVHDPDGNVVPPTPAP
jgi:predicted Zn-dependent peptidase